MNKVLSLKGTFQSHKHPRAVVMSNLPANATVSSNQMRRIKTQMQEVHNKWEKDTLLGSCLVSIHYKRIIPKSKRITNIIKEGTIDPNECIVGVRFEDITDNSFQVDFNKRHVFTYNVSLQALKDSIERVSLCADIIDEYFGGTINAQHVSDINSGKIDFDAIKRGVGISKGVFTGIVTDCEVIHHIEVDEYNQRIRDDSLISLYKTKLPTKDVLRKIGIDITDSRMLDECTVRLYRNEIDLLQSTAPYLIAMLNDFSQYDVSAPEKVDEDYGITQIPDPTDEPTVGVIDTHFDNRVYFHKWVDYRPQMDEVIEIESIDYRHGTAVSSIIVDGPSIEPKLEDGCGRFRVRHFGVAKERGTSSFEILKKVQSIIKSNTDIKVWNLSLGALYEVPENSISAEAAILDRIQSENDVIFVVAGTNDWSKSGEKKIGAPADSINSIVVNAVRSDGKEASYSRRGPVLGFFYKPDLSAYGGDTGDYMRVCDSTGEAWVAGTSFAAPWITRKMAFLIHKMGLNREVAKALLIDSAAGWNRKDKTDFRIGYGIVPTHIRDILETRNDEIRFTVTGTIKEYETYNYSIPVPTYNNMYPFWARATLVYFPYCNRNQGVDYTSTEVDLHFGRVFMNGEKVQIKEIDNNKQANEELQKIYEADARMIYRKWDNVKHISEEIKTNARPRKTYGKGMWGLKIVTKERGSEKKGKGMQFGAVITLREMNGVNRIDEFIKLCGFNNWLVNPIDIDASLDLYDKTEGDITWD